MEYSARLPGTRQWKQSWPLDKRAPARVSATRKTTIGSSQVGKRRSTNLQVGHSLQSTSDRSWTVHCQAIGVPVTVNTTDCYLLIGAELSIGPIATGGTQTVHWTQQQLL